MRYEPTRKFRTLRGKAANYKVAYYSTLEERNEAAARAAAEDGENVLLERWSPEHPQDYLNKGWACDGVAEVQREEPEGE